MAAHKVFISYSTVNKQLAESLYRDLNAAGAEAFQFVQSAVAGIPGWPQVVSWISQSDTFIVLISQYALASRPVKFEIGHALYEHINNDRPSKLISAIIEPGATPPTVLKQFATIDLLDYKSALPRLLDQLSLQKGEPAANRVAIAPALDLDEIFADYRKASPLARPAEKWNADVERILTNYEKLKPPSIGPDEESLHVRSILQEYSGKSSSRPRKASLLTNKFFEDLPPDIRKLAEVNRPKLSEFLLNYEPPSALQLAKPLRLTELLSNQPLTAPQLERTWVKRWTTLKWTSIPAATRYVLERSTDPSFSNPTDVYQVYSGDKTELKLLDDLELSTLQARKKYGLRPLPRYNYYRVKATGGFPHGDSPWSNVVEISRYADIE